MEGNKKLHVKICLNEERTGLDNALTIFLVKMLSKQRIALSHELVREVDVQVSPRRACRSLLGMYFSA